MAVDFMHVDPEDGQQRDATNEDKARQALLWTHEHTLVTYMKSIVSGVQQYAEHVHP